MLLIGMNGFASLCPCYDDRDQYVELTTFWFPLFYGFQSTMSLLVLYNKLCDGLRDANDLKVFDRTKSMYHLMIGLVLFMVMLLTLALGALETVTLILYIVVMLFVHVVTIGVFLSKLMAIYKDSGKSYDRGVAMASDPNTNPNANTNMATANAMSPRGANSTATTPGGRGFGDTESRMGVSSDRDSLIVPVSRSTLLAEPVTLLIRLATILTASLCIHCAFVIWFAAVYGEEDGDEYPVISTFMYYASLVDVVLHFMATMKLHDAMEKEIHFCVRSVPHSFAHPLQSVADAEMRAKQREMEAQRAQQEAMGFHITNSTRDVIIGYEDKTQGAQVIVADDEDDDDERRGNLDQYEMRTIE